MCCVTVSLTQSPTLPPPFKFKRGWKFCHWFALGYLLMLVPNTDGTYIFPTYGPATSVSAGNNRVDSKVSDMWRDMFNVLLEMSDTYLDDEDSSGTLKRINEDLRSHNGKKLAQRLMSDSSAAGFAQVYRGGWLVNHAHTVFDYIVGTALMDTRCAKTLAGWFCKCCVNSCLSRCVSASRLSFM